MSALPWVSAAHQSGTVKPPDPELAGFLSGRRPLYRTALRVQPESLPGQPPNPESFCCVASSSVFFHTLPSVF